jgi:anti-anti-sigma factor
MSSLQITQETIQDRIVFVDVVGKIDDRTCGQLKGALREIMLRRIYRIILDLSKIDYIGSIGVSTLIDSAISLEEQGGKLILLQPGKKILHVFRLFNVYSFFAYADSREKALERFVQ